jgi:hypothetical protein
MLVLLNFLFVIKYLEVKGNLEFVLLFLDELENVVFMFLFSNSNVRIIK